MANDNLQSQLELNISDSVKRINEDLKKVEKKIDKLTVGVSIDPKTEKQLKDSLKAIQEAGSKAVKESDLSEPYKIAQKELKTLYNLKQQYAKLPDVSTESANHLKQQIEKQYEVYKRSVPVEGSSTFNLEEANTLITKRLILESKLQENLIKTAKAIITKDTAEINSANKLLDLKQQLESKIDNTLVGDLSNVDISALTELKDNLTHVDVATEGAEKQIRDLGNAYKQLKSEIKNGKLVENFGVDTKSSEQELVSYISKLKKVSDEQVKIQGSSITFGDDGSQIKHINALVNQGENEWREYQYAVNSVSSTVRELDNGVKQVDTSTNELSQGMANVANNFTTIVSAMLLRFAGDELRKSLDELKNIDTQLVQLSKVTDLQRSGFKDASLEALDTATEWGRKASSFLEASAAFAKAGKDNYKELSELSLIAESAGDMTSQLTSEWLIASDAAFKYFGSIEKLTALLDAQNQVSNRSSVELKDLAEGTKELGSIAAVTGESEKTMTALLTAGIAATKKSGHEIGNALESIIMRTQRVSGETKVGDLIDEEAISKADAALQNIGIRTTEIKDGIVQLRTASSVIEELAEKYHSGAVNSLEFSKILQDVAGLHHANTLAAIVDRIDLYEKAMSDFEDSTGSAAREAQKELDSWESKLNILSNSVTKFTTNMLGTEIIKDTLDTFDDVVNSLSKVAEVVNTPVVGGSLLSFIAGLFIPMALKHGDMYRNPFNCWNALRAY